MPNLRIFLVLLSTVALLLPVFVPQQARADIDQDRVLSRSEKSKLPSIKFEKYTLDNGLEVILSEDHRLPLVAVNLWYHVGPANERPGLTGFAHLFEHMMFEGSKHVGAKAHFKYLESAGASTINGTTDFDRTNYFETVPSNQLELALWLESDRMGFLLDKLDAEKLANQRDVVRNERRQSIENMPYGLVEEEVFHTLYPKGHPYYASVIGSHKDVEAARIGDVRSFFKQYYSPNNASIAIVGDFDKARVKELVRKYFGSIARGPDVPPIEAKTPKITKPRRVTVTDKVELPRIYMSWIGAPIYQPGDAEADMIAHILGGGKSSRLYKKLVYEKQIAQDVTVYNYSLMLGSVFMVQATAKPGVKIEDLEKAINEELVAFRKDGATKAELEGARNSIEAGIIRRLDRLGGFGGKADRLNQYNHFLKDPGYLPRDIDRYEKASLADLKKIANQYLTENSKVIVLGVPGKKKVDDVARTKDNEKVEKVAEKSLPSEEWRKTPPKPATMSKLTLPIPKTFKLDNGLTVYLNEGHELPNVAMQLVNRAGRINNPADKPGLASFTADMLDEGTKNRDTLRIAADLDQLGARLGPGSRADESYVVLRSLKKTIDPAMSILADVVLNPSFKEKEIKRVRNERVTSLLQDNDNPRTVARRVMYRMIYGDKHPYAFDDEGTQESNKAITRKDLVDFYKANYAPNTSALIFAGDLTMDEARELAEKYFGKWKGTATEPEKKAVKKTQKRAVYIVDKGNSPQTAVRIGTVSLSRTSPDYIAASVMNNGLGGMFSSRLNMNLREKRGYTYGARSTIVPRLSVGAFVAGAGIRTNVTGPAINEFFKEIDGMRSRPLSTEELKMAKDNWALSLAGLFETTPSQANSMGNIFVYGLPLDYYRTLPDKIYDVTAEKVEAMASKYLDPEKMVIVAVGDKKKIKPELIKLDLGSIAELDCDAKPVDKNTKISTNK